MISNDTIMTDKFDAASKMSDDEDSRILCKYGVDCYQKNPAHHEKYKHPRKRNRSPEVVSSKKQQKNTYPGKNEPYEIKEGEISDDNLFELADHIEQDNETLELKKKFIKKFFLLDMPQDFYQFWEFCKELNDENPKEALKFIGLHLVGPFDIMSSDKILNESGDHLLHWRYYFDPPEFQTIIKGDDKTEFHIGYFRDSPEEFPVFVAGNQAKIDCVIKQMGANIFGAVNTYIETLLLKADPFKKIGIVSINKKLREKAKKFNIDISKQTSSMQERHRITVCKSFHTAGIVVPFDIKSEVGYRELLVRDKELLKLLDRIANAPADNRTKALTALQPVITAATIAIDECDFGTGLELGIDLFCYGHDSLDSNALSLLSAAYSVLDRDVFAEIAKAHLGNRKKGTPIIVNYG